MKNYKKKMRGNKRISAPYQNQRERKSMDGVILSLFNELLKAYHEKDERKLEQVNDALDYAFNTALLVDFDGDETALREWWALENLRPVLNQ